MTLSAAARRFLLLGLACCLLLPGNATAQAGGTCPAQTEAACGADGTAAGTGASGEVSQAQQASLLDAMAAHRLREALPEKTIPGLQIGWGVNSAFADYMVAIDAGKPMILLLTARNCAFCDRLIAKMTCPRANAFAGEAVFSVGFPSMSEEARQLFDAAEASGYPALIAFRPDPDRLHIIGQAIGELTTEQIESFLIDVMAAFHRVTGLSDPGINRPSPEQMEAQYADLGLPWAPSPLCAE